MGVVRQLLGLSLFVFSLAACTTSGVGDPCMPEQIPDDGFNQQESYLETSSVQCRTRVCMVRGLQGDPELVFYAEGDPRNTCTLDEAGCQRAQEVEDHVYCTCRCRAPEGSNTPTCPCPGGFTCEDVLETGGVGIQGGYCVKNTTSADGG